MAVSPIAFSELMCYMDVYRPHDPERFITLIGVLDRVYLERQSRKKESQVIAKKA